MEFKSSEPLLRKADQQQSLDGNKKSLKSVLSAATSKKNLPKAAGLLVVAVLVLVSVNYVRLRVVSSAKSDPKAQQQAEKENYVKELQKLTYPPEKEQPTSVAIIADANKARQQNSEFYRQAKNGDVLVMYKSIVYILDAKNHKIVNIAPVNPQ